MTTRAGEQRKSQLLTDFEVVADAFDLGATDCSALVHWCHKGGVGNGMGCCKSREESVEKTAVPLLNWLIHRSWDAASVSRWTYVLTNLRKIAVGFLANALLPAALIEMQIFCGVSQGMEVMLAKMLAADEGNFSAREKLRLLKICRSLCHPQCGMADRHGDHRLGSGRQDLVVHLGLRPQAQGHIGELVGRVVVPLGGVPASVVGPLERLVRTCVALGVAGSHGRRRSLRSR